MTKDRYLLGLLVISVVRSMITLFMLKGINFNEVTIITLKLLKVFAHIDSTPIQLAVKH